MQPEDKQRQHSPESSLSDYPDSDDEASSARNVAEEDDLDDSQTPGALLAAQFAQELRNAYRQDLWFQVLPLTTEEVEKMYRSKERRMGLEVMPGKVFFGEHEHEKLGSVKVWGTMWKLAVIKQTRHRIVWRMILFNDGDYADVKVPRSPSGNVSLHSTFSLLWTEELSARHGDQWTERLSTCIRVALIDASYSERSHFKTRARTESLADTIRKNLAKQKGPPPSASVFGESVIADMARRMSMVITNSAIGRQSTSLKRATLETGTPHLVTGVDTKRLPESAKYAQSLPATHPQLARRD